MDPPDMISIQQQSQIDMREVREKFSKFLLLKPISQAQMNSKTAVLSESKTIQGSNNSNNNNNENVDVSRSRCVQVLLRSLEQLVGYKEGDHKENMGTVSFANEPYQTSSLCIRVLWKLSIGSAHKPDRALYYDTASKHLSLIESLYDAQLYNEAFVELKVIFGILEDYTKSGILSMGALPSTKISLRQIVKGLKFRQISQDSTLLEIIARLNIVSVELISSVLLFNVEIADADTISPQDLIKCTSKGSNFYYWLEGLPPHSRTESSSRVSQLFHSLSTSNRTIMKLVYLFKSLEFSIMSYTENDVLNQCLPIFSMMIKKNEQMVYQYTSSLFFHICGLWKERNLPLSKFKTFLKFYSGLSATVKAQSKLDWGAYFSSKNDQDSLVDLLRDLKTPSSNITRLADSLDESNDWYLYSDVDFCTAVKEALTNASFDERNKKFLTSTVKFLQNAKQQVTTNETTNFYKFQLEIFDLYMIKLKPFNVTEDPTFVHACITSLFQILRGSIHAPRLRNISNYLLHAANSLINCDYDQTLKFCMSCINIEYNILSSEPSKYDDNMKIFKMKSGRIANLLINCGKFDDAMMFISKVFELYKVDETKHDSPFTLQSLVQNDLSTLIKLCAKITMSTRSVASLKSYGSCDLIRVLVLLEIVVVLNSTVLPERTQVLSKIIIRLKQELNDSGLFLFFLSQVSFISEMNISPKTFDSLEFPETSSLFNERKLISSHILLLQCCTSTSFEQELLQKSYENIFQWSKTTVASQRDVSDYEVKVIMMHIDYLSNNGLDAYSLILLDSYLSQKESILSQSQQITFNMRKDHLKLNLKRQINITNDRLTNKMPDTDGIDTTLLEVEYNINTQDLASAETQLNILIDLCDTNDTLNLNNVSSKMAAVKLLLLFHRICYLSSQLFAAKGDYPKSITELKKAIRVYQVIVSTFLSVASQQQQQQKLGLSFSYKLILTTQIAHGLLKMHYKLLDSLKQIGHSKEYNYYQSELAKLASVQKSPYSISEASFYLTESALISERIDEASKYLVQGVDMHNGLIFVNKFLDLQNLSANEFYYQILGDADMLSKYTERNDDTLERLLSGAPLNQIVDEADFHKLAERQYYFEKGDQYSFLLYLLKLRARRISSIVNGKITDKELRLEHYKTDDWLSLASFIKAKGSLYNGRKLLLNDPVFLNLQDSAIFMKSISVESSDDINRKIPENITGALDCFADCGKGTNDLDNRLPRFLQKELNRVVLSSKYFMSAIDTKFAIEGSTESILEIEDEMRSQPLNLDKLISTEKENTQTFMASKHDGSKATPVTSVDESSEALYGKLDRLMPTNWAVISIDCCPVTGDLLLTRYTPGTQGKNVMFRLPLNRHNSRDVDQKLFCYQDAIREMGEIIDASNKTTSVERTSQVKTKQEKADWWSERKDIDKRLEVLLNDIQFYWFGGFRGIFSDSMFSQLDIEEFKEKVMLILSNHLPSRQPKKKGKSTVPNIELSDSIFEMFLCLGSSVGDNQTEVLEDLIYFILDVLQYHGETNAYDEIDFHQLLSDLSELLRTVSVSVFKVEHFILMVSGHCVTLPWESIPSLRNKSVSRIPSLQMLTAVLERRKSMDKEIDSSSGYYIINPSGDLLRTESNFKEKFTQMHNWSGIVRNKPSERDIVDGLTQRNLYVYIGHGGGEHYIKSKTIKNIDNCAPVLLLGCSSGSLKVNGFFDPYGTVYDYLLAGSPMVLCNLWDVTDKDIDKFTISLFQKWGLFVDYDSFELDFDDDDGEGDENSRISISAAMADSRDVCVLKYLNGAAPVLYGVPFFIK